MWEHTAIVAAIAVERFCSLRLVGMLGTVLRLLATVDASIFYSYFFSLSTGSITHFVLEPEGVGIKKTCCCACGLLA